MKRIIHSFNDAPYFWAYHVGHFGKTGGIIPSFVPKDDKLTLEHAIAAYSFLIPRGHTVTGTQFASLILDHYASDRAYFIAQTCAQY